MGLSCETRRCELRLAALVIKIALGKAREAGFGGRIAGFCWRAADESRLVAREATWSKCASLCQHYLGLMGWLLYEMGKESTHQRPPASALRPPHHTVWKTNSPGNPRGWAKPEADDSTQSSCPASGRRCLQARRWADLMAGGGWSLLTMNPEVGWMSRGTPFGRFDGLVLLERLEGVDRREMGARSGLGR